MSKQSSDRGFFILNAIVSSAALLFLSWLVLRDAPPTDLAIEWVPALNACFNATAAVLLCAGWYAIRTGRRTAHQWLMSAAFLSSSLFLVGYIAYHYLHGDTLYEGPVRGVYLAILASHVLLSLPVVPMALSAFYFAWKERFKAHRRVTRILAPVWIYVSVTGVIVFLMLHG